MKNNDKHWLLRHRFLIIPVFIIWLVITMLPALIFTLLLPVIVPIYLLGCLIEALFFKKKYYVTDAFEALVKFIDPFNISSK